MKPENVNPSNFKVDNILFDNGSFSIAYGKWLGKETRIAMRWNGDDNESGYPKHFGNPVWFLIDHNLNTSVLKSLLEVKSANNLLILKALESELK